MSQKYVTLATLAVTVEPGVAKTANTPAKRPVTKNIAPGTVLVIDKKEEADELIGLGAIRKATSDDTKDTHVESLTSLTEEQKQAAAVENARVNREQAEENKRREAAAQAGLDAAKGKGTTAPKTSAKANASVGKPAASPADAKNGNVGASGTGGNKDGTGTNPGANTTANANGNPAGSDDGGLV